MTMLLERSKAFNNDRRAFTLEKDAKYAEKEGRLLAKSLDVLSKDARRVSRNMAAEQRNLIRRSTSVHAKTDITYLARKMPESPVMHHATLYGEANTYPTSSCSNTRKGYSTTEQKEPLRKTSGGSSRYSDNMMQDLRSIANRALSDIDKNKPAGRERRDSWGLIKRESIKERKNSKADNLLQQNISKWHSSFQRTSYNSMGQNEAPKKNPALSRTRKTGYTAEMNRSYSCDLPRIHEAERASSRHSRYSEPVISLQKYSHVEVHLPRI